jgi:hypothetical protein
MPNRLVRTFLSQKPTQRLYAASALQLVLLLSRFSTLATLSCIASTTSYYTHPLIGLCLPPEWLLLPLRYGVQKSRLPVRQTQRPLLIIVYYLLVQT